MKRNRFHSISRLIALATVICILGSIRALAMINPDFTPVRLVRDSSVIVELVVSPAKDNKMTATVTRVVQGKDEAKTIVFDLSTSTFPAHIAAVSQLVNAPGGTPAIFFSGGFNANGGAPGQGAPPAPNGAGPAPAAGQSGLLHVNGKWVAFTSNAQGGWNMEKLDDNMDKTWNGGTDMLTRAADYIVGDPEADMPVKEGITWAGFNQIAKLDGAVHAAMPVDLAGDGQTTLYIACETGDRLFKYDDKAQAMKDVTADVKLTSKSKVATWVDINATGRMDLLSWDGEGLTIYTQAADGTFQAGDKLLKGALTNGCLALTPIDCGKPGHPAVLISTTQSPLLWNSDAPGAVTPIGGIFAGAALGAPGPCLVADFDGDGIPDIIQTFEKGSLVYAGKAPGQFQDAKPCAVALGSGTGNAFVGDFDAKGMLDIFTVASNAASAFWNNRGKFQFADTLGSTGELSYKGTSGAIGGWTGDINNDGRQDVLFYYDSAAPHIFFNRGFRSFGQANGIDVGDNNMIPDNTSDGEQAACLADLNGDGAQDMVLVLKNGAVWIFFNDAGQGSHCVRGVLSSKGPYIGPLVVTGWRGDRCLGAWNVTAGTSEAFVGLPDAGKVTLKWQFPGQKPQAKEVVVENKPVRIVIGEAK